MKSTIAKQNKTCHLFSTKKQKHITLKNGTNIFIYPILPTSPSSHLEFKIFQPFYLCQVYLFHCHFFFGKSFGIDAPLQNSEPNFTGKPVHKHSKTLPVHDHAGIGSPFELTLLNVSRRCDYIQNSCPQLSRKDISCNNFLDPRRGCLQIYFLCH